MPDVARTAACGRWRAPRAVSMPRPSSASSVSPNSAPRGTAMVRPKRFTRRSSPASARCRRSTPSAKPTAGSVAAEAPEQVVVAPAAADRRAERRVVDVEHGARVVAEPARQPEVDDDARGDARRRGSPRTSRRPVGGVGDGPATRSSTSGPPRSCGTRTSSSAASARRPSVADLALQRRRSRVAEDLEQPRAGPPPGRRAPRSSAGYSAASPRPIAVAAQPRRRRAPAQRTASASAVPAGAGAPTSSMPACRNSRICPRCGRTAR